MNAPHPLAAHGAVNLPVTCSDGVHLSARAFSPTSGQHGAPRLVMSHGNGLAIGGYRCFWQLLMDEFQVVVFDMRGHGRSEGGAGWRHNWTQFYDDIEALRQTIDLQLGPAPTFGAFHSLSAVAAIGHRRRYGPRWDGLLLFDPPFMPPDGHPVQALHLAEVKQLSTRVRQRRRHFPDSGVLAQQFARQPMFRRWRPEAFADMADATLKSGPDGDGLILSCAPECEAFIYDTNSDPTLWRWQGAPGLPTMLVCSDPDAPDARPSAFGGQAAAAEFSIPYMAVPDTSHFLQIEQPELCADITRRFCREILTASSTARHRQPDAGQPCPH